MIPCLCGCGRPAEVRGVARRCYHRMHNKLQEDVRAPRFSMPRAKSSRSRFIPRHQWTKEETQNAISALRRGKIKEFAENMGVSVAAAQIRAQRCRRKMKKHVAAREARE